LEDYNLNTVMAPANLPSVVDDVVMATQSTRNTWWDVTPGAGNTGQETLAKGKAFTAFLTWKRYFEIHFISATQFTMWYSDTGLPGSFVSDKTNGQDTVGVVDQDEVFTSAKAFILKSWWTGGTAAVGDTFRFSADPSTDIVEIPVLFQGVYDLQGLYHGATAFSSDSVNSLVDGSIVFTPETYGPVVNYSGSGAADILHDYVDAAFQHCCGLVPEFVDARYYHDGGGSIHCATNDIRLIPESHWWL
jgi:hypothetical protein